MPEESRAEQPLRRVKPALIAASCWAQWILPGAGYLLLGRFGRAIVALVGVGLLYFWGLHLGGEMAQPVSHQLLSYLKTFACLGLGLGYFAGRWRIPDATDWATAEYGSTFVIAGGLIAYLLILDVYDIAMGRKG